MKTCTQCEESKTLESFRKDGRTRDGLAKKCEACRSVSKSRLGVATGRGAEKSSQAPRMAYRDVLSTFNGMTRDLEPQSLNVPWPFTDYGITSDQGEAWAGIALALLRKDASGSKFLLSQVCTTWEEVMSLTSFILESVIDCLGSEETERITGIIGNMTHC